MQEGNIAVIGERRQPRQFRSIRTRLIFYFGLLFVIVMIGVLFIDIFGVPLTSYTGLRGHQRDEAFKSLELIADLKKERLLRWIQDRNDDIYISATNELVKANADSLLATMKELRERGTKDSELWALVRKKKIYRTLVNFMDSTLSTYGVYNKIQIADAETGMIFVSTDNTDLGTDISASPYFAGALSSLGYFIGGIKLDRHVPILHTSHIITNSRDVIVALLVMEVNTEDIIKPMLHTGEGLGEEGEALLVNQDVRILTSLKHPLPDGTKPKPLKYQIKAKPAALAARGEEGIIDTKDYRGEPVLAAYRHVRISSEWGWGMVLKVDKAELFTPFKRHMAYNVSIVSLGILAVIGITIFLARGLTRPILSLSRTADKIAEGDLDARASLITPDEVGNLAMVFNFMIERVQDWHKGLEEQVKIRAAELNKMNKDLMMENTERKRTEEALRKSEAKYYDLYDNAPDMFVSVDAKTAKIIECNKTLGKALGFKKEEIIGLPIFDVYHPECMEDVKKAFRSFVETGEVCGVELQLKRKDGSKIEVSLNVSAVHDDQGNIINSRSIWRDITDRKRAEEAVKKYSEQLEDMVAERTKALEAAQNELIRKEKLAVLGQLAGGMGHELRNPLGAIKNAAYFLNMAIDQPDPEVNEALEILEKEVQASTQIISSLLDFARPKFPVPRQVNINEIVREALSGVTMPENVEIVSRLDETIPKLSVDPHQLEIVFGNLIINAIQAMPGGGRVVVRTSASSAEPSEAPDEKWVEVSFTDTGAGMSEETLQKVFEPLYTTKTKGIGLGLALSKMLVEGHGGTIQAESKIGEGSTFTVKIPVGLKIEY